MAVLPRFQRDFTFNFIKAFSRPAQTEIFSILEFISCFKIIFQPIRAQGRVALINKEIDQTVAAEEMNNK